jgi:glycerol-3-phosphate acyltransferase PlsY
MNGAAGLLSILALLALSYLAGSFPTSVVISKLFFKKDIRTEGSGNAGGTNAFRVLGWKAGVVVVIVDVGKGLLAAAVISRLGSPSGLPVEALGLLAGSAAVGGHIWTVFAGFRGGKGIATAAGALLAIAPLPTGAAALVFALILLCTGIVSLGSISAALAFPATLAALYLAGHPPSPWLLGFSLVLAPLIVWTHRSNIGRLKRGEEKRFEHLRVIGKLFDRARGRRD